MKTFLKTSICVALVAGLCGCEKIDLNLLVGSWSEQYDPTVFAMDGSRQFMFYEDGTYRLLVYDALSGRANDFRGTYVLDEVGKNTLTFHTGMTDSPQVTYEIVKLTSKELDLQKAGTTYSQGGWASDYLHFVRVM